MREKVPNYIIHVFCHKNNLADQCTKVYYINALSQLVMYIKTYLIALHNSNRHLIEKQFCTQPIKQSSTIGG